MLLNWDILAWDLRTAEGDFFVEDFFFGVVLFWCPCSECLDDIDSMTRCQNFFTALQLNYIHPKEKANLMLWDEGHKWWWRVDFFHKSPWEWNLLMFSSPSLETQCQYVGVRISWLLILDQVPSNGGDVVASRYPCELTSSTKVLENETS